IAKVIFEGNEDLKTEELNKALQTVGLSEGKVFNPQTLDKVEQELTRQYFSQGKYSVKIETKVSNLTRNRVGIHIDISEGQAAKIKQINIVGHQRFETDELLKNFELSTTNLLSFYTKDDQYAKQKLSADLERLTSFYLDQGYLKFTIESSQISMTPNKKEMYVTVNIKEGEVYTLSKVKLAGNLIVDPEELIKLMQVGPGEIFSRKNATATSKNISDRLGDEGYIFSNVNMIPDINEALKTVEMTFFVDPGKRVYVRKVNISGNDKTRDEVVRREMRQMESSWASTKDIERSKARLSRLGYFESVDVETPPVVGSADQIDVNYSVVEKASGNLSAGVGFSQTSGFIINANVSQDNIFGSGKRVNLAFNNSDVSTQYQFGYYDPYFTLDGVSMGYDIGYRARDAENANISRYSTDVFNSSLNFGLPLNENDRLRFNIDFRHTKLKTSSISSTEILDFVNENGNKYLTLSLSIGWTHDTLNRAIFPTSGGQQRFSALATVPGSDLEYYKINYKQQHFFSLSKDFTLRLNTELAYGDGYGGTKALPFFEHFFAGGTRSIRGFDDNTLGPRDSRDDPFGGAGKIIGNAELLFPVPFFPDLNSVRLGTFFDAGTVTKGFDVGDMRYSVGLSGQWLSPFGALTVSIAKPLNSTEEDKEKMFQFSFGSGF
ncbi:MAG: outer membrane protein assembly factor BamA, partial [Methylococcales bacterium]|nr:outer membrane protein assembly factor BamA [Methylococcales bacterium]